MDCRGIGEREGQQAIYDKNGNLVLTPENMGTYDFIAPGEDLLGHKKLDVDPWLKWGNSQDDTTTQNERKEAYNEGLKKAVQEKAKEKIKEFFN